MNRAKRKVPVVKLFTGVKNGAIFSRERSVMDLAAMGDKLARNTLKMTIYKILASKKFEERMIDYILSGYYINYYGTSKEISSTTTDLLTNKINLVLISKSKSSYDDKLQKLSQVVFQECFGYGVLDEFIDLGVDSRYNKVEEIAAFGPDQLMLKVSGVDYKLDKVYYPEELIEKVANRLSRKAETGLSHATPRIETELLDQSRVTLTTKPLNAHTTFNIRLHYSGELSIAKQIELGSTTREFENFLDLIMNFHVRIVVAGAQGSGKTTRIRDICRRYEPNTTISTVETSFELALDNIPYLIVNKFDADVLSSEELLKTLFRVNAKTLILGESRTPEDIMLFTQMSKRQANGSITTYHSSDPKECIYDMANTFLRGEHTVNTFGEALSEVSKSIDIIMVQKTMEDNSKHPGKRHISICCEVPTVDTENYKDFKLIPLFEYDYEKDRLDVCNPISADLEKVLLKRNYDTRKMSLLRDAEFN